jgi:hypothetical protein
VIGLKEKFLGPSTVDLQKVEKDFLEIKLHEPGELVLFSANGTPVSDQMKLRSIGNNFYQGTAQTTRIKIRLNEK